jgi:hypothetical protein
MVLRPLHGPSATLDHSTKDATENVYDALHTLVAIDDARVASVCGMRARSGAHSYGTSMAKLMRASVS